MSDEIKSKLASSDAFQSLQMEGKVATLLRAREWPANQSAYYRDIDTQKIREVDVHAMRVFRSADDDCQVVINFHIFAECKNLHSQHLLFLGDQTPPTGKARDWWSDGVRLNMFWLGNEVNEQFHTRFAEALGLQTAPQHTALFKYLSERSHPGQMALIRPAFINLPGVDIISRGFRETNTRETRDDTSSVMWSTILSLQSAMREVHQRALDTALEWIFIGDHKGAVRGSTQHTESLCFFFDSELSRIVYIHPVIFTRSRLWNTKSGIEEVKSVRLVIGETSFSQSYVDIVSDDAAEEYIQGATALFDKMAKDSIKRIRKDMRENGWKLTSDRDRLIRIRRPKKIKKPGELHRVRSRNLHGG